MVEYNLFLPAPKYNIFELLNYDDEILCVQFSIYIAQNKSWTVSKMFCLTLILFNVNIVKI